MVYALWNASNILRAENVSLKVNFLVFLLDYIVFTSEL